MSSLITPPPRTSSLVVDRMHELIRDGEWSVGARIPAEPELVEMFGVGRNTIREAVRALEHSGLLAPRRGDGTYVRSRNVLAGAIARCVTTTEIEDLLSTRRALETEAAALAAQRGDAAAVTRLRGLLADADAALDANDIARYTTLDIEFHIALIEASGNHLLIEIFDGIGEVMRAAHESIVVASVHNGHPEGHAEVVAAIAAGDADAARAAVHSYLEIALGALR